MVDKKDKEGKLPDGKSESEIEPRRFSTEVGGDLFPDAVQVEVEGLLGEDILIMDFTILSGKFGNYAIILFTREGDAIEYSTACGGIVVLKKLQEAREKKLLPLIGSIKHDLIYYDIV